MDESHWLDSSIYIFQVARFKCFMIVCSYFDGKFEFFVAGPFASYHIRDILLKLGYNSYFSFREGVSKILELIDSKKTDINWCNSALISTESLIFKTILNFNSWAVSPEIIKVEFYLMSWYQTNFNSV